MGEVLVSTCGREEYERIDVVVLKLPFSGQNMNEN
jgi:hypothetical protein